MYQNQSNFTSKYSSTIYRNKQERLMGIIQVADFKAKIKKKISDLSIVLLVHITVIIRSKNIFNSLESFQRLQLLNTHLVNFKFVIRNYFFTVFTIYFVDRKYEVSSQIDIGIKSLIFRIYIFDVESSYSYHITFFFLKNYD